jgi:hypothetical protein
VRGEPMRVGVRFGVGLALLFDAAGFTMLRAGVQGGLWLFLIVLVTVILALAVARQGRAILGLVAGVVCVWLPLWIAFCIGFGEMLRGMKQ